MGGGSLEGNGGSRGQVGTLTALWGSPPPRPRPHGGGKGQRKCGLNSSLSTQPHFAIQHGPPPQPLPTLSSLPGLPFPPPSTAGVLTAFQEVDLMP